MRCRHPVNFRSLLCLLMATLALGACDKSRQAYALTSNATIIKFDVTKPKDIESEVALSGLATGEKLLQIDFRPNGKGLYGLVATTSTDTSGNVTLVHPYYVATIDPGSGVVSKVGTGYSTSFTGTGNPELRAPVVADVNPQGDYLRVIDYAGTTNTTTENNLRFNFDGTTAPISDSTSLQFNSNDTNFGATPELVAIAHSNSVAAASSTTLYGLELSTQSLVRITTGGQLYTIAAVDHGFIAASGFDIVPDGDQAFVAINTAGVNAELYKLNLSDGTVGSVDQIGGGYQIVSLAVYLEDENKNDN